MKEKAKSTKGWQLAITFAEAGAWDIARSVMPDTKPARIWKNLEQTFTAVAYAEEGMFEEAIRIAGGSGSGRKIRTFLDTVGLADARVTYANIPMAVLAGKRACA